VIEHVALEVELDQPYLVDVGFGESSIRPLALNRRGRQDGGSAEYQFIASPEGTTLALLDESDADAVPVAQYRFKRVAHSLTDFAAVAASMQFNPDKNWHKRPFATRLLDCGPDRVTLTYDRLKVVQDGNTTEQPITINEWSTALLDWFGIRLGAAAEAALRSQIRPACSATALAAVRCRPALCIVRYPVASPETAFDQNSFLGLSSAGGGKHRVLV
jgi:N-hydroxyarylamine O-acetyltransferase